MVPIIVLATRNTNKVREFREILKEKSLADRTGSWTTGYC